MDQVSSKRSISSRHLQFNRWPTCWDEKSLEDFNPLLRVGGRIDGAAICYDAKHRMFIPQDHQLCRLVIMDCHKKLNHEGTEHVRNELRLLYWIPHSRSTVRKVLNDCSVCKRRRVKPQPPLMASLPKDRLQVAPPFSKVGVDYFGHS